MTRLGWLWGRFRATPPAARAGYAGVVAILLVATGLAIAAHNHPRAPDPAAEVDRIGDQLDADTPWEARDRAADGGKLTVRERGLARLPESELPGRTGYTVAVVLENTSRTDAVVPELAFEVHDEDGRVIDAIPNGMEEQVIPPGARLGVTDMLHLDEPVAAEVSVSTGDSQWYGAREDIGEVTAAEVRVDGSTLRVDIASSYDTALLAPVFQALFRDRDGKLLGGTELSTTVPGSPVPPGASEHAFAIDPLPNGTDRDAIEVYVLYDQSVFRF